MIIYPAIDIKDGRCVRLLKGDFDKQTVYSTNPVDMALNWERQGAKYLHVVDLDGAKTGSMQNFEIISDIIKALSIPVQVGGGIRSIENAKQVLEAGANRIIMGTSAITQPDMINRAVQTFGEKIIVGVDSRDGFVAIEGWGSKSKHETLDFAKKIEDIGVKTIIYTEISKDGTLQGPDFEGINRLVGMLNIDVIASGGIGCIEDIKKIKDIGAAGIIVGKALYSGNVTMKEISMLEE